MEKIPIKEKIPGRKGLWDLLEKFSANWVDEKISGEEYLAGPAHRHPFPELFISKRKNEDLILRYITPKGKVRRIRSNRIWVDGGLSHQILVPTNTGFEVHTCQENLEQAEVKGRLEDFLEQIK